MVLSRREFVLASIALGAACGSDAFLARALGARISARPRSDVKTTARGRSTLGLGGSRDGVLQMPSVIPAGAMPLVVLLHGAGGRAAGLLDRFGSLPESAGVAALSLDSRGPTWDGIRGGFGPDVSFIDRALEQVFGQVRVDPDRLAIGGFSDGATYGLSLGLINGDLFRKIVAFSPGFLIEGAVHGRPRVFVSHGTADEILPIERCSRVIVPALRKLGYDVTFREFTGGHQIPTAIATEGLNWVAAG